MLETNSFDSELWVLVCIIAIPISLGLLINLCILINDFSRELEYINREIHRTDGAERRHWIRQRRRLWLSLIPFVKY